MKGVMTVPERLTSADHVYQALYDQIIALDLLPGTRLSEAQVAEQFDVSRQPVREAFNRLGAIGLLLIRPQRGTLVQKFSVSGISAARFIRLAVELEVIREAATRFLPAHQTRFEENIGSQEAALSSGDTQGFHTADEDFHRAIADVAERPFAFDLILQQKAQIDRLCVLSLKRADEMTELVRDHRAIHAALSNGDAAQAADALRLHLSRIAATIEDVRNRHPDYFAA